MERTNEGYKIISSVRVSKTTEIVIGHHKTAPSAYVVWYCKYGNDYFHGSYHNNYESAVMRLFERVTGSGISEYTEVD